MPCDKRRNGGQQHLWKGWWIDHINSRMHPRITEGSILFSVILRKGKNFSLPLTFNLPFKKNTKDLTDFEQTVKKYGLFKQPD